MHRRCINPLKGRYHRRCINPLKGRYHRRCINPLKGRYHVHRRCINPLKGRYHVHRRCINPLKGRYHRRCINPLKGRYHRRCINPLKGRYHVRQKMYKKVEQMLHNYDSQMWSVLFWSRKWNKIKYIIRLSLVHGCRHCAVVTSTGQNCSGPHVTSHVDNQ